MLLKHDILFIKLLANDTTNSPQNNNIEQETPNETKYSIWQVEYYQQYFNVNTTDVLQKIIGSMMPTFNQSYLINRIRPNPGILRNSFIKYFFRLVVSQLHFFKIYMVRFG